jgi:DNA-binding transcriptional MerR regulator
MSSVRYQIVRYRYYESPGAGRLLTVSELAQLVQLHPNMIDCLVDLALVDPAANEPEVLFHDTVVPRIWKIMRLRRDLGINWKGMGVVLDLLDRIEELEREVARLRRQP